MSWVVLRAHAAQFLLFLLLHLPLMRDLQHHRDQPVSAVLCVWGVWRGSHPKCFPHRSVSAVNRVAPTLGSLRGGEMRNLKGTSAMGHSARKCLFFFPLRCSGHWQTPISLNSSLPHNIPSFSHVDTALMLCLWGKRRRNEEGTWPVPQEDIKIHVESICLLKF